MNKVNKYIYYPMQMHLHTCHQPGGSMEGHIYNAAKLGMEYIRFTDHDVRTGQKQYPVDNFDFTHKSLTINDGPKRSYGWNIIEDTFQVTNSPVITFSEEELILTNPPVVEKSQRSSGIYFQSSGRRHTVSLIANVTLKIGIGILGNFIESDSLLLDVKLSQRPPNHIPAHMIYVIGKLPEINSQHTAVIPLDFNTSESDVNYITLPLSKDILDFDIGGLDNVFDTISIIMKSSGCDNIECHISEFQIIAESGFDDVIKKQRIIADNIGNRYGVKTFVTTEVTGAGHHKNCFSTSVPVINYFDKNYNITQAEAIEHILSYGGIFSYNHPFSRFKAIASNSESCIIAEYAAELIASGVYGASMIEIGFTRRTGRLPAPISFTTMGFVKSWWCIYNRLWRQR